MAPWSKLPSEIVEQILEPLDTADLVSNVSRVNHELGSLAWREYLKRYDITESKSIVVDDVDAHLTLRALHMANWIKNVPTLTVRLHLNRTILRKIHSLAHFIRGLDSLGALNFYITKIDDGFPEISTISIMKRIKSSDQFYEGFRILLNAAFSKGLEELHIYEPSPGLLSKYVHMEDTSSVPGSWSTQHWVKKKWFKLLSYVRTAEWHSKRKAEYSTICLCQLCCREACRKARIKDMRLSPMLSSRLFGWDTLSMLDAHASTIHTLNLDETYLVWSHKDRSCWEGFLQQLQFPLLEQFTFTGAPERWPMDPPTSIDALLLFLERHPTITHLEITPKPTGWEVPFTQKAPSLSNLRTLIARNDIAAHILQRPGNCEHLELVHFWSQPASYRHSKGPMPGLAAIASNASHPIKVELMLDNVYDCLQWLVEGIEITLRLTQVHDVRILLWDIETFQDMRFLLEIFPKWLGLFPVLEKLRVDVDPIHGAALCIVILRFCPRLKSLMINEVVFHPKIK